MLLRPRFALPSMFALVLSGPVSGCGSSPQPPSVGAAETTSATARLSMTQETQILSGAVGDDGHRIPIEVAARARCVAVVPQAFQGGQLTAGRRTEGVVSCRTKDEGWSNAGYFVLTAGPTSRRVEAGATDLVILVSGAGALSTFTDRNSNGASVPPWEREPPPLPGATASVVCYSHDRGRFVGVDLGPLYIKPDHAQIRSRYREDHRMHELLSRRSAPLAAYPAVVGLTFDWPRNAYFSDGAPSD